MPRSKPGTRRRSKKNYDQAAKYQSTAFIDFTATPEIDQHELELANASNHYVRRGHGYR